MARPRPRIAHIAALASMAWLVVAPTALANGRMPGANDLALTHGNAEHLLVRATFGLVQSFDTGDTWQWVCEQAIDVSGVVADPPVTIAESGSLVLLPPTGSALVSHDRGCSWTRAPAPLAGHRGVDLTLDPQDAAHVLVLTSTIAAVDDQGFGSYTNLVVESNDSGQTWSTLATLPSDFEAETLEVAASDARRVYVSGTASVNPRLGILYRSEDGGHSWHKSTLDLPAGTGSLFVSAIAPSDPDTLWVRVPARGDTLGILPGRLYVSVDKGQTFRLLASTKQGMFGFALSPDGKQLAYGGPGDGLFVGPSDGSEPFAQVSKLSVRCLRWPRAEALFACGSEPQDDFSLGVSKDQGKSFSPLYRIAATCPQECAAGSSFAMSCEQAWSTTLPFIGASGAMCAVPWAQPEVASDAGPALTDAGNKSEGESGPSASDASKIKRERDTEAARGQGSSGSCRLGAAGERSQRLTGPLALLAVALTVRLRRRLRS